MRLRSKFFCAPLVGACLVVGASQASAGLFDFLFGDEPRPAARTSQPPAASAFADPFGLNAQPAPPPRSDGPRTGFCVRTCDGRYFPLSTRGGATPAQMCQSFCPASGTRVYFGGTIESATSASGERYADSERAFEYRKSMRADCTCNGRDPTGLAPVDLSLDTTLRPGDVIATSSGLVAYSGTPVGGRQTAEFTPVANYPGLTADVRARLGEMKVSPVSADIGEGRASPLETANAAVAPRQAIKPAAIRRKSIE